MSPEEPSEAPQPLLTEPEAQAHAQGFCRAWNGERIGGVLSTYDHAVVYLDPNLREPIRGQAALSRYLHKLFEAWTMSWTVREAHPLADRRGYSLLWHGSFRRRGSDGPTVELDGMDLVELNGARVSRNEVRFDRSLLLPLRPARRSASDDL